MTTEDYIRKGLRLAIGFTYYSEESDIGLMALPEDADAEFMSFKISSPPQHILDALAAQLVRQVDEAVGTYKATYVLATTIGEPGDRSINPIKAIVDSGVLE